MKVQFQDGVRSLLCTERGTLHPDLDPDDIDTFIADHNNLLWLDVDTTVTKDLGLLKREFNFHELALEDATRPNQRPKIDTYDSYSFIVFYSLEPSRSVHHFDLKQLAIFVGPNYLVTVHQGPLHELEESAGRLRANVEKIERSVASMLYSLLDTIVDAYFPVIDHVVDLVEDIEESVFERFDRNALQQVFTLRKSMLAMRRVVAPERDVLNAMLWRGVPLFGAASYAYFQDIYDHLVRVTDSLDIYRDLLSSVVDAYLSMSSNRLNEVMRTLAGWTIPLMAAALIAGIWGMNFEHMPELKWRLGYPFALIVIGGAFTAIALYFRRRRWL